MLLYLVSHSKRVNNVSINAMKMKNGSKLIKMLNYVLVKNHVQKLIMLERTMKMLLQAKTNVKQSNVKYQTIMLIHQIQLNVLKNVQQIQICGIMLMKKTEFVSMVQNVQKNINKLKMKTNVLLNVQNNINTHKKNIV